MKYAKYDVKHSDLEVEIKNNKKYCSFYKKYLNLQLRKLKRIKAFSDEKRYTSRKL